jgi:small subunit ribosomal protein S4
MARYTGAKDRLSRRENFDLFNKAGKLTRLNVLPGVHGAKGTKRSHSQYGRQLREKQKVKRFYGVLERQFRNYVRRAFRSKGNSVDTLFWLLESRLDNTLVRLGFANTRPQARQLVSHRHVLVNGKKVNIPSYRVEINDTISLSPKAMEIASVMKLLKSEDYDIPGWLKRRAAVGKVVRKPVRADVAEPFVEADIVEFYSR